jgi:thiol-disulfide isomerase/thioredoxin
MRKLTILLLLCVAALLAQGPRRAPGFALFDSNMRVHDLYDYHGKIVVLELMQTTCPHCATFADTLAQVEKKYGDKVQILSVVHAPDDNSATVARFASGHGIHYPILFDQGQMAYSYILSTNMQFPHVYLIDGNGMIQGDYLYGITTRDVFEGKALFQEIDRLLGGKK